MPSPWTYSYLIESAGRPVHLFRLSPTSRLSPKSGSPAQLQQQGLESNMSHQANPEVRRHFAVLGFFLAALSVSVSPDEACSLFALQSCVFGCEGNVADVRKTV